jgi:hypothetical protein
MIAGGKVVAELKIAIFRTVSPHACQGDSPHKGFASSFFYINSVFFAGGQGFPKYFLFPQNRRRQKIAGP